MITFPIIWLGIKKVFWFLFDNWKITLPVIVILVAGIWAWRACSNQRATIDQDSVNRINKASEKDRMAELGVVIQNNAGVIKTVDERNTIAEVSEAERQAQINAKIKEADAKIAAAKAQGRDVTQAELECILVPETCQ